MTNHERKRKHQEMYDEYELYSTEEEFRSFPRLDLTANMSNGKNVTPSNIFTAAKLGNIEGLDTASINCKTSSGLTALMVAAEDKNLLAYSFYRKPDLRVTALTIAVEIRDIECVEELIRAGCFFNCDRRLEALEMAKNERFRAAVAEGEKAMQKYLKDDSDQSGTAFYVAFINERIDLLYELIDAGVSINLKSLTGENLSEKLALINNLLISPQGKRSGMVRHLESLLTQAVQVKDISIIRILIEKYSDFNIVHFSKNKALQIACSGDRVELINVLLVGAKMEAVSCCHIEIVKLLVSSGADVNLVDEDGSSLLIKAVLSKQMKIVNFLIEKKVNIDQADDSRSTALHYACRSNNLEIVKLIVNAGAKVEGYNNESYTPFSEACKISQIDMMELLIKAGSDINCLYSTEEEFRSFPHLDLTANTSNGKNVTPSNIFTASKLGNIEGWDTASINCTNSSRLTAVAGPNLHRSRGRIHSFYRKPDLRVTALTIAMEFRDIESVKKLIRAGCFFNCDRGLEALEMAKNERFMAAVAEGEKAMQKYLKDARSQWGTAFYVAFINKRIDLLYELIDAGVSINLKSLTGENLSEKLALIHNLLISPQGKRSGMVRHLESLLTQAVQVKDISIIRILIEKYCDFNIVHFSKNKALQVACSGDRVELINVLLVGAKMEAVSCSYVEIVELLVSSGADVNLVDEDGSSLLIKAVQSKQMEIVNFLIEKKVNIDQADDSQSTALHYACRSNNLEIVKLLVNAGAKVEGYNNESSTPFSEACKISNIDMMKLLINAGSDINCVDKYQRTPLINSIKDHSIILMHSIIERNLAFTQFLLEHGADISNVDKDGMTALMWAAKTNNEQVFDLLIDLKPEVNCVDLKQMTALAHAVMSRNVQMVAKLIQAGADVNIASNCRVDFLKQYEIGNNKNLSKLRKIVKSCSSSKNTPLHLVGAIKYDGFDIMKLLLKSGANIHAVDEHGRTPLHIVAVAGHYYIAEDLYRLGAKINALDNYGMSPLFMSLVYGNEEVFSYLLSYGADVNLISEPLGSPLFAAVLSNDKQLIQRLIHYGAILDVNIDSEIMIAQIPQRTIILLENGAETKKVPALTTGIKLAHREEGYEYATPMGTKMSYSLEIILKNNLKRVAESFLNDGANVSAADDEGNTYLHLASAFCSASILELFVDHKPDVNVQNAKGETPLMMACRRGNINVVRYLISLGADVTLVDVNKDTALHHTTLKAKEMCRYNNVILEMLSCTITHLIENNANIHARNGQGNTALHLAAKFDLEHLISVLIKHGANVNDQNNEGNTPLFLMTNDKLIHFLVDDRTDINLQNKLGETALHNAFNVDVARALLEIGADMNIRTHNGRTALLCATFTGKFPLAQFLVEHGVNVNVQDNEGKNALILAIEYDVHNRKSYGLYSTDFLNILLEHGADVNARDATGQTACMIAVKKNSTGVFLQVLPKLVAYGADLNKVDSKNRTVLIHILLKFNTNKLYYISQILKLGADMAVDNEYQYLVKEMSKEIETHKEYGRTTSDLSQRMFQFYLVNGCILLKAFNLWGIDKALRLPHFMSFNSLVFVKYLFANGMIFKSDLQMMRKFEENVSVNATKQNIPPEFQSAIQQPWPLVKLAFIEVSTLLGTGPMREEKLKQTKLPPRLQRTLMFQEPISRLPVEDWSKIPLCFDTVQYETLPCPRPLLYYWPVGHRLVI
ncbi:serine/threonine-protein phosphatase 6 regulatory ankyrin repeat subunit C-like [Physella acuta]|uniref:serine/threonine-protein phosphatase 6 regulatory ankyrin repeat subunit C-like n=1 Tax=Physella acuta TaxID=109671 RepID=UPI0027DCF383|nr:serine/threonine-protein phosphatase 6 regulatory ankyrin repeat subunit C-like [Physella acuta]